MWQQFVGEVGTFIFSHTSFSVCHVRPYLTSFKDSEILNKIGMTLLSHGREQFWPDVLPAVTNDSWGEEVEEARFSGCNSVALTTVAPFFRMLHTKNYWNWSISSRSYLKIIRFMVFYRHIVLLSVHLSIDIMWYINYWCVTIFVIINTPNWQQMQTCSAAMLYLLIRYAECRVFRLHEHI